MGCPPRSEGPSTGPGQIPKDRTDRAPWCCRGTTSVPPPRMWPGLSRWLPAYGIAHGRRGAANHVFSDPAAGRLDGSGSSTGFVQWCRPPRLKQLPPAGLLSRSRSRPRGGLEHGAGPADGQHSPIGLMCRIYGAVRFQIRGGARPALVTELKPAPERLPRSFPPCPAAAEGGPRTRRRRPPLLVGEVAAAITLGRGLLALALATRRDAGTARDAGRRPCSTSRGIGTGAAP